MIVVATKPRWLSLLFRTRGSVVHQIRWRLVTTIGVAAAVAIMHHLDVHLPGLTALPFSLIGLALSIFLGFRNNTSYQRYWEGRILWGRMVNTSRSFARQATTMITGGPEARALAEDLVRHQAAYVHALRIHLRGLHAQYPDLARLIGPERAAAVARRSNPPIAILEHIGAELSRAWQAGWIDPLHLPVLEASLTGMTDHQGGCERIRSTPIPFSYTILIHRIVAVYCLALPFGIVGTVGAYTPIVAAMVAYAFFGLDAIGDAIEEPFGLDVHDLPLDALSTMIEVNVREAIGDTDLPALKTPVDELLT